MRTIETQREGKYIQEQYQTANMSDARPKVSGRGFGSTVVVDGASVDGDDAKLRCATVMSSSKDAWHATVTRIFFLFFFRVFTRGANLHL